MNEMKLSNRLETVAAYIPEKSILADIGSDHAYLPCYAYLKGLIVKAVAGEITDGPLKSAKEQVEKAGLKTYIDVRKGDGLEVISPNEVTCITIAGMGGSLITSILEGGKDKLEGVKRLVLQPNIGAKKIREWLIENNWELIAENILDEDGKIYEVLVAERGSAMRPYTNLRTELLVGPFLLQEKNEVFLKKWSHERKHFERILSQLEQAEKTDENLQKKAELIKNIEVVKEFL
ncbi:tRNA (adenine(22)-N(1))-methyltransferase TrmK [Bacillus timonensis]|nr:tRNA (adenine(22)-N(1))-methyltransferase TrmK [Bacillus timonensis]